jgi:drug/metabolite transporter (DMT)-like permease
MWGTDPLFRQKLALNMPAPAIVAFEQALPALLLAPLVWRGLGRAIKIFNGRDWLALVVLGCGASALATLLFTYAFTYDHPNTPVLLQQLQPLFAIAGARVVLGERLQHRYGLYLLGGLAGSYLIAFPHPLSMGGVSGWAPALLAVAAAGLWGFGTVLGRRLGAKLPFAELTALRLATGLVAAVVALGVSGDGSAYGHIGAKSVLALVLLALVPGLLSLLVYYRGLRATPAASSPSPSPRSSLTTSPSGPPCRTPNGSASASLWPRSRRWAPFARTAPRPASRYRNWSQSRTPEGWQFRAHDGAPAPGPLATSGAGRPGRDVALPTRGSGALAALFSCRPW